MRLRFGYPFVRVNDPADWQTVFFVMMMLSEPRIGYERNGTARRSSLREMFQGSLSGRHGWIVLKKLHLSEILRKVLSESYTFFRKAK